MYDIKQSEHIIYVDRQTALAVSPTIFADDMCLPFRDAMFDTIIFDPPHGYGREGFMFSYPYANEEYKKRWKDERIPRYYGLEQYKNRQQLAIYLYKAQQELNRIAKDDAILIFKWCDMDIPLDNTLSLFTSWQSLLRIEAVAPEYRTGTQKTYWIFMQKKADTGQQLLFSDIPAGYDSSVARFNPSKP
jgi:hypothetical protein